VKEIFRGQILKYGSDFLEIGELWCTYLDVVGFWGKNKN